MIYTNTAKANMNPPIRTMRDYFQLRRSTSNSCIVLPINEPGTFSFKLCMFQHIPSFHGMESENSYLHLKDFAEISFTFRETNMNEEAMRLKL